MAIRTEGWLLTFRVISKSCLSPTFPIMPVLNLCSRQCRYPSANPRNPLHDVLVTASKREADVAARALPKKNPARAGACEQRGPAAARQKGPGDVLVVQDDYAKKGAAPRDSARH